MLRLTYPRAKVVALECRPDGFFPKSSASSESCSYVRTRACATQVTLPRFVAILIELVDQQIVQLSDLQPKPVQQVQLPCRVRQRLRSSSTELDQKHSYPSQPTDNRDICRNCRASVQVLAQQQSHRRHPDGGSAASRSISFRQKCRNVPGIRTRPCRGGASHNLRSLLEIYGLHSCQPIRVAIKKTATRMGLACPT